MRRSSRLSDLDEDQVSKPLEEDWSWLDAIAGKLDDDFVAAVNAQPGQQERGALNEFFR